MVDVEHQQRQWLQVAAGQIHLALQHLIHGDAVASVGQRITQSTLQGLSLIHI